MQNICFDIAIAFFIAAIMMIYSKLKEWQDFTLMSTPYRRCCNINEAGLQCETWFPAINDSKLCDVHSSIATPNGTQENKVKYIDLVNTERATCHTMSFEELDIHIAELEKVLENQKTKLYSALATRSEKIDKLSEEERKELRKIKVDRAVRETPVRKATIKSDPIKYLMQSKGMSEQESKDMMSMDIDEYLLKYKKNKENK